MDRILLSEGVNKAAWLLVVRERELADLRSKMITAEAKLEEARQEAIAECFSASIALSDLQKFVSEQLSGNVQDASARAVAELDDSPAAIEAAMKAYQLDFSPDALVQETDKGERELSIDDPAYISQMTKLYGLE